MPRTQNRAVMIWLFVFAGLVAFLVVYGGFVRLTRSGLSIVEWNPVSGAIPPIGEQAWQVEYSKYQQAPEFQQINFNMTLEEYQYIFYVEWIHRFLARLAGLVYAIPVFYFLFRRIIPFREFGIYLAMGMLFIGQAFMGWYMVASGLVDRPSVSHFRLTVHLLFALTLLGLSLWIALGHKFGFPTYSRKVKWSMVSKLAAVSLVILIIQISYGGMTAGLKAGHVSDTWPLMFGRWIPAGLFNSPLSLLEMPQTIVFIHRWFAWLGLIAVSFVYWLARRRPEFAKGKQRDPGDITNGLLWLIVVVALQIALGILTVLAHVNIVIALIHQANALLLFATGVYFIHRLRARDAAR